MVWFHGKNVLQKLKLGFKATFTFNHFEFETKLLLAQFGFAARLFVCDMMIDEIIRTQSFGIQ